VPIKEIGKNEIYFELGYAHNNFNIRSSLSFTSAMHGEQPQNEQWSMGGFKRKRLCGRPEADMNISTT